MELSTVASFIEKQFIPGMCMYMYGKNQHGLPIARIVEVIMLSLGELGYDDFVKRCPEYAGRSPDTLVKIVRTLPSNEVSLFTLEKHLKQLEKCTKENIEKGMRLTALRDRFDDDSESLNFEEFTLMLELEEKLKALPPNKKLEVVNAKTDAERVLEFKAKGIRLKNVNDDCTSPEELEYLRVYRRMKKAEHKERIMNPAPRAPRPGDAPNNGPEIKEKEVVFPYNEPKLLTREELSLCMDCIQNPYRHITTVEWKKLGDVKMKLFPNAEGGTHEEVHINGSLSEVYKTRNHAPPAQSKVLATAKTKNSAMNELVSGPNNNNLSFEVPAPQFEIIQQVVPPPQFEIIQGVIPPPQFEIIQGVIPPPQFEIIQQVVQNIPPFSNSLSTSVDNSSVSPKILMTMPKIPVPEKPKPPPKTDIQLCDQAMGMKAHQLKPEEKQRIKDAIERMKQIPKDDRTYDDDYYPEQLAEWCKNN